MLRAVVALALLTACGQPEPEPAIPATPEPEVQMEAAEMMIPASEAEMLREEIRLLQEEREALQAELAESKAPPTARQVARLTSASSELVQARQKLKALQAELEETKARLAASEEENEVLRVDLAQTEEQLAETEQELKVTEKDLRRTKDDLGMALRVAADAGWSDLVAQAQVELCPKGGRKKMERCRDEALASVAPLEPVVRACLRSGQATPQLARPVPGEPLPSHAIPIGDDGDDVHVLLCDPTLPEARALLAQRRRAQAPSKTLADPEPATRKTALTVPVTRDAPRDTPDPREPVDLLSDDIEPEDLGLIDLDEDTSDDDKRRKRRRKDDEDEELLEELDRRDLSLEGVGDDLFDE